MIVLAIVEEKAKICAIQDASKNSVSKLKLSCRHLYYAKRPCADADQSADAIIPRHTHVTSTNDVIPINDVTISLLKQLKHCMGNTV